MTYTGTAHGRIVELEDGMTLPEGTRVRVIPEQTAVSSSSEETFSLAEWLEETWKVRAQLPVTSDSTEILRQMRIERASR